MELSLLGAKVPGSESSIPWYFRSRERKFLGAKVPYFERTGLVRGGKIRAEGGERGRREGRGSLGRGKKGGKGKGGINLPNGRLKTLAAL